MGDLIDRQRALDAFDYWVKSPMIGYSNGLLRLHEMLEELPSVTQEPKTGHWIELDNCSNSGYYCSECQKRVVKEGWSDTVKTIKYCPNCGCKMCGGDGE